MSQAETTVDEAKAEAFGERLMEMLNSAATALMTSVGHRTGLFDVMAQLEPSSSEEIARAAGLNARYVREWLGTMVTAGFVQHDAERQTFWLPAEHAAVLTRAAAPNNVAAFAQYIPMLGGVEDRIVECFREGGGVPYSAFPRFQQIMVEDSTQSTVSGLLDFILPLVPGLQDRLQQGIRVLDVGCGSGRAMNLLAETFPNSTFLGYDLSEEAIGSARADAERRGLENIQFEVRDVSTLESRGGHDLITAFDAVHDQAKPQEVLAAIARALEDDGIFLMQDIAASSHMHENAEHPIGPFLYTLSCMHCMTVSLAQGGEGLGAMWGEQKARALLREAGFERVRVERLPHDFQNHYFVAQKT